MNYPVLQQKKMLNDEDANLILNSAGFISLKNISQHLYKILLFDSSRSNILQINKNDFAIITDEDYMDILLENFGIENVEKYNGSFFEFIKVKIEKSDENTFYFILPKYGKEDIRRDKFWKQRCELHDYFENNSTDVSRQNAIKLAETAYMQKFGINDHFSFLTGVNDLSQGKFEEQSGKYFKDEEVYGHKLNNLNSTHYSHTKLFSWIYSYEAKIIGEIVKKLKLEECFVLELGSSFGNPVLTKKKLLEDQPVKFIGVDKSNILVDVANHYKEKNGVSDVDFVKLNLGSQDWKEKILSENDGKKYDVACASHILEHINGDLIAVIKDWLEVVDKALVISLPLDDNHCEISAHEHSFDVDTLKQFTNKIKLEIGDIEVDYSQIDAGIFVIYKDLSSNKDIDDISDKLNKYGDLDDIQKGKLRFQVSELLAYNYSDQNSNLKTIFDSILDKDVDIGTLIKVLREIMFQPMASSWFLLKNLRKKYNVELTTVELRKIYEVLQLNIFVQDMIRFNSAGSKVLAVARGSLLRKKTTSYYLDVQLSDVCPNKCKKCWNYYEDENSKPHLIQRKLDPSIKQPIYEDYKKVFFEAIDSGVMSFSTTGGGEPFMYTRLADLYEEVKLYAKSKGQRARVFIPTSGLGKVFRDKNALTKLIKNMDLLRFSLDSFDKDFVCDTHGITEKQYEIVIQNLENCVEIAKEVNPNLDIEVLILIYEDNYKHIEETVQKAKELGLTRVLFNSITGKEDIVVDEEEMKLSRQAIRRVYEKAANGDYYPLVLDFDPVLMGGYADMLHVDKSNMERPLGNMKYCMKNVFGLTPVVTADGTFHVCFPCSQPLISNKDDIFKVGNIMNNTLNELLDIMRDEYRKIDPERDCIKDCRDIPYFNGIFRKVIDDMHLGIPVLSQPFLDRSKKEGSYEHSLHDENFEKHDLVEALQEFEMGADQVRKDQKIDFKHIIKEETSDILRFVFKNNGLEEGEIYQYKDRYETRNLFDINIVRFGAKFYLFSYDGGFVNVFGEESVLGFGNAIFGKYKNVRNFFRKIADKKTKGEILIVD